MSHQPDAFYPPIESYATGRLKVSELHEIFYEEVGNPDGKPVIFLHGGPGAGLIPLYRQAFDPELYRVVLMDQRGSGQSTPKGELRDNTTWDIVEDIENLRVHLGIDRWQVFGGSWGGTLALAYAQTHPDRVTEMILRGVCLWRRHEFYWELKTDFEGGAKVIFPEAWETFIGLIPEEERQDLVLAYYKRLTGDNEEERKAAARGWGAWESARVSLIPDPDFENDHAEVYEDVLSMIEAHYIINGGWLKWDSQLLDDCAKLRHIPCICVFGRYDMVTPVMNGWEMKQVWPEMELLVLEQAGHAYNEPAIAQALVAATDRFAKS